MTDENMKETVGLKSEFWSAILAQSSRIRWNCNINGFRIDKFTEIINKIYDSGKIPTTSEDESSSRCQRNQVQTNANLMSYYS